MTAALLRQQIVSEHNLALFFSLCNWICGGRVLRCITGGIPSPHDLEGSSTDGEHRRTPLDCTYALALCNRICGGRVLRCVTGGIPTPHDLEESSTDGEHLQTPLDCTYALAIMNTDLNNLPPHIQLYKVKRCAWRTFAKVQFQSQRPMSYPFNPNKWSYSFKLMIRSEHARYGITGVGDKIRRRDE